MLKDIANLAFASAIVEAPNDHDHIALDMTVGERDAFVRELRMFGNLEKAKTLQGVDIAAYVLQVQFAKEWRLAK